MTVNIETFCNVGFNFFDAVEFSCDLPEGHEGDHRQENESMEDGGPWTFTWAQIEA